MAQRFSARAAALAKEGSLELASDRSAARPAPGSQRVPSASAAAPRNGWLWSCYGVTPACTASGQSSGYLPIFTAAAQG